MSFSPRPSMSMASRWANQRSRLLELLGAGRRGVGAAEVDLARVADHRGAAARAGASGRRTAPREPSRASASTRTTWGMISPAFWITTVSPTRMSLRAISSALCRLARLTVVPASGTGSRSATGVSLPVLPTWTLMSEDLRDRLLGLVLERDRPARALAPRPQPLALAEVVDLDDQAVGLEVERVPLRLPALGVGDHLVDRVVDGVCGLTGMPHAFMRSSDLASRTSTVDALGRRPARGETNRSRRWPQSLRVEQLERAGGRVPRVGERRLSSAAARSSLSRTSSELVM